MNPNKLITAIECLCSPPATPMLKVLGEATTKFASVHAQGASCREHQRLPQYHGQHLSGHAPFVVRLDDSNLKCQFFKIPQQIKSNIKVQCILIHFVHTCTYTNDQIYCLVVC